MVVVWWEENQRPWQGCSGGDHGGDGRGGYVINNNVTLGRVFWLEIRLMESHRLVPFIGSLRISSVERGGKWCGGGEAHSPCQLPSVVQTFLASTSSMIEITWSMCSDKSLQALIRDAEKIIERLNEALKGSSVKPEYHWI